MEQALSGRISFSLQSGSATKWGYHVAVAYLDTRSEVRVLDGLLSPSSLELGAWLSRFQIVGAAVLTFLPGAHYLFNNTEVPALDELNFPKGFRKYLMTRNVFDGNFYGYEGDAARNHEGARDLAADALAAALTKGDFAGCDWMGIADQALKLKAKVQAAPPWRVARRRTSSIARW